MTASMLGMRPREFEIVEVILSEALPPGTHVWAFGSRARQTARKFSDLDLAVDTGQPLTRLQATQLRDLFEESDLPFSVDLVDLQSVSPAFRTRIEEQRVELKVT